MDKRFITFLLLSFAVLSVNMMVMRWLQPPAEQQQKQVAEAENQAEEEKPVEEEAKPAVPAGDKPAEGAELAPARHEPAPKDAIPEARYTLGSADAASEYRQLVTFINSGAAIERIELNSPRYLD